MAKNLIIKRHFWLLIAFLILVSFNISASPSAPLYTEDLIRRADMLAIAERYASHAWEATQDNILHGERLIGSDWWQD